MSGSDEGVSSISASDNISTETIEGSDGTFSSTETMNSYGKSLGSHYDATSGESILQDDVTQIMVDSSRAVETQDGSSFEANSAFLEFNTRTGVSTYNGEEIGKDIYRAGKRAAETGGSADEVEMAMARAEAYNRLSWWNAAKALAGNDPIELLEEQEGQRINPQDLVPGLGTARESGQSIDGNSIAVADMRGEGSGSGNNTVVAPTTNNVNNQTVASPRRPARNQDPTAAYAFSQVG